LRTDGLLTRLLHRGLTLPLHQATTAHLCSVFPLIAESGPAVGGPYLGTNVLAGGAAFRFDPFTAYAAGLITNPNMLICGEPGTGKSATAKCFVNRACGVFGRWVTIVDPKGEYAELAAHLGLDHIRLRPGGSVHLNPLDPGPIEGLADRDEIARRRAQMVAALLGCLLRRDLSPLEDAALGWACAHLDHGRRRRPPTLGDLAAVLAEPTEPMAERARCSVDELARQVQPLTYGLGKLLDRSLKGMFDGPTNVDLDWNGPGLVIDLSAVHQDPDALAVVLVCVTAWLQAVLARPDGPPRIQLLDEAWALLASERTSRYLQSCWKLGRSYGVANVAVVHRLSDLRAQADDGTATAKVAAGLLADTQTRVLFRQASDQVDDAQRLLGLTTTEAAVLGRLCRGRAIWKTGAHTAVVQHAIGRSETFCYTDVRMAAA
jgi:type IV secretory pathway VirB4 component